VALILSELKSLDEEQLKCYFAKAWENSYEGTSTKQELQKFIDNDNPVLSFRCINSKFVTPSSDNETLDAAYEFYNLLSTGRSPSPSFLVDSIICMYWSSSFWWQFRLWARSMDWTEEKSNRCENSCFRFWWLGGTRWRHDEQSSLDFEWWYRTQSATGEG
jgi:hypothetical protein